MVVPPSSGQRARLPVINSECLFFKASVNSISRVDPLATKTEHQTRSHAVADSSPHPEVGNSWHFDNFTSLLSVRPQIPPKNDKRIMFSVFFVKDSKYQWPGALHVIQNCKSTCCMLLRVVIHPGEFPLLFLQGFVPSYLLHPPTTPVAIRVGQPYRGSILLFAAIKKSDHSAVHETRNHANMRDVSAPTQTSGQSIFIHFTLFLNHSGLDHSPFLSLLRKLFQVLRVAWKLTLTGMKICIIHSEVLWN